MNIRSILLVDDEPSVLEALRMLLEPSGYAVAVAESGREALRLLRGQPADLVITDVLMPDMDGLELVSILHRDFAHLRVVVMSGGRQLSADTYLAIARGFRVDWVLRKPFTREQLLEAIAAIEDRAAIPAAACGK